LSPEIQDLYTIQSVLHFSLNFFKYCGAVHYYLEQSPARARIFFVDSCIRLGLTTNPLITFAFISGLQRCGKSCRLRWLNYLRPNIKRGNYTEEEEEIIISLHETLGNRYSFIDFDQIKIKTNRQEKIEDDASH